MYNQQFGFHFLSKQFQYEHRPQSSHTIRHEIFLQLYQLCLVDLFLQEKEMFFQQKRGKLLLIEQTNQSDYWHEHFQVHTAQTVHV